MAPESGKNDTFHKAVAERTGLAELLYLCRPNQFIGIMISRRNIRVKVMQTLYALDAMEIAPKPGEPLRMLNKHFDQTQSLFVYVVHFITEVARYAETDAHQRASKHLPTAADLQVNTKVAGNAVVWSILENPSYISALEQYKPQIDREGVRKFYQEWVESEAYQTYIMAEDRQPKSEKDIIQFLYQQILLPSERFISHLEEQFSNWDDDCEMVNLLVLNYLQKPGTYNLQEMISKEKLQFARELLEATLDKKEVALGYIKPKLKNWDPDRIATLDMIMMQMGVCEFLFFETIPPKVTINEYIDLAKEYSTPQSGQFVNGILDGIHKDLLQQNKLHKVSFKK
jgi:N utilization substance protein B